MPKKVIAYSIMFMLLFSLSAILANAQFKQGTCKSPDGANYCGQKSRISNCYCDSKCTGYPDCCLDFKEVCPGLVYIPPSGGGGGGGGSPPQPVTCKDSDGGLNYNVKGYTSSQITDTTQTGDTLKAEDMCSLDVGTYGLLFEYYCQNNKITHVTYNCPNGCRDGACLKSCTKLPVEECLNYDQCQLVRARKQGQKCDEKPKCPIPECAAPPESCRYEGGKDSNGCETCGKLVCPQKCQLDSDCPPINCITAPCPQNKCVNNVCTLVKDSCGNGVCDKGEDDYCPPCTTDPCPLASTAACYKGTCPQDCSSNCKTGVCKNMFFIEDDGTLRYPEGTVKAEDLAKKFYQNNNDMYDFIVVFTTFNPPTGADYFVDVKNDIKGIGKQIFDNSNQFGTSGKLKGLPFIHAIDNYVNSSADLLHELSHYWLMWVSNFNENPSLWISRDGAHWSHFMDTATREGNSLYLGSNGGNPFKDNGDGTFVLDFTGLNVEGGKSPALWSRFNTLELYLMGLLPKSEAKPLPLIVTNLSQKDFSSAPFKGFKKLITVGDLVAIVGERVPPYPNTQKDFKVAFVLFSEQGKKPTDTQISKINWIAENFPKEWSLATNKLSTINEFSVESCTDSDGGKNYYVIGTSDDGTTQKTDSCYDNNRVREFFCVDIKMDSNNIGDESYTCPNGCKEGACIKSCPPPPPCTVQLIYGDPDVDDPNNCPRYSCPVIKCPALSARECLKNENCQIVKTRKQPDRCKEKPCSGISVKECLNYDYCQLVDAEIKPGGGGKQLPPPPTQKCAEKK